MMVVGTAGTAQAAAGRLTLFSGSVAQTVTYDSCRPAQQYALSGQALDTFVNQPAPGCQALLVDAGRSVVLCAGSGTVPIAFRNARFVRFQPGAAPDCGLGGEQAQENDAVAA
ncbi:hypothetical protein GCM10022224_041430 [Nonomuraea antimicrobica]|uniref:Alpha amylase inhibitor n=1 Tax=Nonomuraea antimicrobica TaxID=561173 RepID=A0ABP7BXL9_9ACTN